MANIIEVKQIIAAADECGHVPLIEGLHGIGKSESAYQYAKEKDLHFEPLILSLMEVADLMGIPESANVGGLSSTTWAAPTWYSRIVDNAWPESLMVEDLEFNDYYLESQVKCKSSGNAISRAELNDVYCKVYGLSNSSLQILRQSHVTYKKAKRSLLLLDEFNRAPQDILNASLQLVLDHRLHSHILPLVNGKEILIVAAVNPASGNYTVQEFDPALLDRFVMVEAVADLPSWTSYARKAGVNQIVIDFLAENPRKFHFTPEDGTKGASPRSWTRLASYLDTKKNGRGDELFLYIKGTVGSALAAQFIQFYETYSNSVTQKDVDKKIKAAVKKAEKAGEVNPDTLSEQFKPTVLELEAILRGEYADIFVEQYINKATAKEAMPMLVFLYSLPIENLTAVIKSLQNSNPEHYTKLVGLDAEANNKGLFSKMVNLKK